MLRPTLAAASLPLLACLAAGCVGGDGGEGGEGAPLGELRGVVVDLAIRPIPGVALELQPGGMAAETGADGGFLFEGLAPGAYSLKATRAGYVTQAVSADVAAGPAQRAVTLVLDAEPGQARYANLYKLDGYFECGVSPTVTGCSTANALTGVILCNATGVCANATSDTSYLVQWVEPGMQFLQSEMVWQPSSPTGGRMTLTVGGATPEELPVGTLYNVTRGPSPLLVTLSGGVLEEARLGSERILLVQGSAGATADLPVDCGFGATCPVGAHAGQAFTVFTVTFHGYLPPPGWAFAETGLVPPPPPVLSVA